jgi:hypothetical protein
VEWIHLAQNRVKLWALMNMVVNFRFHKILRIFQCLSDCWFLKKDSASRNYLVSSIILIVKVRAASVLFLLIGELLPS